MAHKENFGRWLKQAERNDAIDSAHADVLERIEHLKDEVAWVEKRTDEKLARVHERHQEFNESFNRTIEAFAAQDKAFEERMNGFRSRVDQVEAIAAETKEFTVAQLQRTLQEIFERQKTDTKKIHELETKYKAVLIGVDRVKLFEHNMHRLQEHASLAQACGTFIARGLPMLIHFQTCEALDKVINGDLLALNEGVTEYKPSTSMSERLLKFEQ